MPENEKKPLPTEDLVADKVELDIEIAVSKGEVASTQHPERDIQVDRPAPEGEQAPGEDATAEETARALRQVDFDPEAIVRAAALLNQLPPIRDEISDADAARMAAMPRGNLGRLAGILTERARQVELLRRDGPGVDEPPPPPPRPPENLPAVQPQNVFARDPNWQAPPAQPRWHRVYDLPRYYQNQIRGLGRGVFRRFPCFAEHEAVMTQMGHDPLGSIQVMANLNGQGYPSEAWELNAIAEWVLGAGGGRVVDARELTFATVMPDYTPRVIVACTETESFLLVQELVEMGAPADSTYIYRWHGGLRYYRDHPQELAGMQRRQIAAARPQLEHDVGAAVVPPRLARPRNPANVPAVARVRPATYTLVQQRTSQDRAEILKALPVGSSTVVKSPVVDLLKVDGFKQFGSSSGPCLRKQVGAGQYAYVFGEAGKSLATSSTFRIELDDEGTRTVLANDASDFEEIKAIISPAPGMTP